MDKLHKLCIISHDIKADIGCNQKFILKMDMLYLKTMRLSAILVLEHSLRYGNQFERFCVTHQLN